MQITPSKYTYGFLGKLHQADETVKNQFNEIIDYVNSYKVIKTRQSFKQLKIYKGRQVLALLLFKGKKLAVAFNLNPQDFEDTKYKGKDVSDKKRFINTPFLMKVTSPRKLKYVKDLLGLTFTGYGFDFVSEVHTKMDIPYYTVEELVVKGYVKERGRKDYNDGVAFTVEQAVNEVSTEEAFKHVVNTKVHKSVFKRGNKEAIINIDSLSLYFNAGDVITMDTLKYEGLIDKNAGSLKVLARGTIDKSLIVEADSFSVEAIKMIAAKGGLVKQIK